MREEIPSYPTKKIEIPCSDEIKFKVMDQLKKSFAETYEHTNTLDGIRIDFSDGWVLIRASNTSPILRLTTEAKTQDLVEEYVKTFSEKISPFISKNT